MSTSNFTPRPLPFLALGGLFEQDDIDAASKVMLAAAQPGGNFFPLPEENQFQQLFAQHEGAKAAVAVNSCGTALDLCMMALGLKPGDEVITTPLTFVCSATTASALGAKVIFADIDPVTLCLDPAAVRRKITPRTKAIIPVHFAGLAADVDGFRAITRDTGVPVIYDAAHAVGTRYKGQPIGGAGKATCYSFQSNKNITTLGEGGAVTSDDVEFAEVVRQKKTFGYVYGPKLRVVTVGFNYRMTKPQLAVGVTQTQKAQRVITQKLAAFKIAHTALADIAEIIRPAGIEAGHGAHLYVARLDTGKVKFTRDQFVAHLKTAYQVGTANHYPLVWSWEAFEKIDHDRTGCPRAELASSQVVSLPLFPQTTAEDVAYLVQAIKRTISDLKSK